MFVIRTEQMDALRASRREAYASYLMHRLRTRFASQFAAMSDEDLQSWVQLGLAGATRHGYSRYDEVELFIDLCAECGLYFDQSPWAGAILEDTRWNARQKLARLDAHVVFALRNAT